MWHWLRAMGSMFVSEVPLVARVSSQKVSGPGFCESWSSRLHHLLSAETDIQYSQAKPTATPTKPGSRTFAQPGPRPPPPPTPTSSISTRPNPVTHFSPAWPFSQADRLTGMLCARALIPNVDALSLVTHRISVQFVRERLGVVLVVCHGLHVRF